MKEIQLIQFVEKNIEKYKWHDEKLKDILNGLKTNFSQTNSIINEYIDYDFKIKYYKRNNFNIMIKDYKKSLKSTQKNIIKIINRKNKTAGNIVLFVFIFIFIFAKFFFEIYIIFFRIFDLKNAEINNRKCYIFIISVFILFYIFFYVLYIFILGDNLRNNVLDHCLIAGAYISMILFYFICCFNEQDNYKKSNILLCSIFAFPIFVDFISYSDCFYYLKNNISYYGKMMSLGIFFSYMVLILTMENKKFVKKNLFFLIFKKIFKINNLYCIYYILIILISIEYYTRKDYFEQNLANKIFVCINFIIFIVLFIISNLPIYEGTNKEEKNEEKKVYNNKNYNEYKIDEKTSKENLKIHKKLKMKDLPNENADTIDKNNFLDNKRIDGQPIIKLFLILIFYWISDEGQNLFGLVILFPFLEILNYFSDYYKSRIDEIIHEKENNSFRSSNSELNSINVVKVKSKKNSNLYISYFSFFIFIQEMFIIANQSSFALIKYSFGLDTDKVQQMKFIYVLTFLKPIFGSITKYRFTLIILGFYLEKNIYDKFGSNKNYSLDFILRKLLLGLRIDLDILYIFYQMLININDRLFIDLYVYFFVNASLFVLDYVGFWINKLSKKIC